MANNSDTPPTSEDQIKNIDSSIKQLVTNERNIEDSVTNGTLSLKEGETQKTEIHKKINILEREKARATKNLVLEPENTEDKKEEETSQQKTEDHKKDGHGKEHASEHSNVHMVHNENGEDKKENASEENTSAKTPPESSGSNERGIGKNSSISFEKDSSFRVNENRNYEEQIGKTSQTIAKAALPNTPNTTTAQSEAKSDQSQTNSPQEIASAQSSPAENSPSTPISQTDSSTQDLDKNITSPENIKQPLPPTPITPKKTPSKAGQTLKAAAKKGAKGYVDIYKYTPLGFLMGKLSPRLKEWELGRKIAAGISDRNISKKEKTEKSEENNTSLHTKKVQKKSNTLAATKKTASTTLNWYKNVYKYSPLGILYSKTKHLIPPSFVVGIKKILPKKTASPNKPQQVARKPKTAKEYQKIEINKILTKAAANGFDRFELLRKIRDAKVWQSKTWKYGRYVISPLGAVSYDFYKRQREQRQKQEGKTSQSTSQPHMQSRILRSGVQNRSPFSMMSNMNKNLGKSLRNKTAQKAASAAAKKGEQQLAKKAVSQVALTFLKTPAGWVTVGVSCVILLFIVFVMTVITIASDNSGGSTIGGGTGGGGGVGQPPTQNPIPSFTLQKTVSQTELAEIGEITYTISYTLTSDSTVRKEDIIIFDQIPENTILVDNKTSGNYTLDTTDRTLSWNLSDSGNAAASSFTFTVLPVKTDINITNSAWAQASASTAGPGGSQSPNACTRPKEGTGYCSYEHLLPYFNNQPDLALTASLICNLESGSDPFATNKVCPDYSIGLFQINLIAHCGGAFGPPPACTVLNSSLRNACEERFLNPIENIQYAYQLYLSGGTGWTANKWSTYPAAQSILASCGNI